MAYRRGKHRRPGCRGGVTSLIMEMRRGTRKLESLSQTLSRANQQLASITDEMRGARRQYGEIIRQQASTIYAKSGMDGRHAFAAWFLEDFLAEQPVSAAA